MPSDKFQTKAFLSSLPLGDLGAKTLDAASAVTGAQQRIIGQMIDMGSSAAGEQLRALFELQSAAIDAARSAIEPGGGASLDDFRQNPLSWYGHMLTTSLDGTERALKLLQTSGQIVAKSAERVQASAERGTAEMQDTARACASRLRQIYALS